MRLRRRGLGSSLVLHSSFTLSEKDIGCVFQSGLQEVTIHNTSFTSKYDHLVDDKFWQRLLLLDNLQLLNVTTPLSRHLKCVYRSKVGINLREVRLRSLSVENCTTHVVCRSMIYLQNLEVLRVGIRALGHVRDRLAMVYSVISQANVKRVVISGVGLYLLMPFVVRSLKEEPRGNIESLHIDSCSNIRVHLCIHRELLARKYPSVSLSPSGWMGISAPKKKLFFDNLGLRL